MQKSHFRNLKICMLLSGLWPERPKNKLLQKIYSIHGYTTLLFGFLFIVTIVGKVIQTIILKEWDDFPEGLNYCVLFTNIYIRVCFYKTHYGPNMLLRLFQNEKFMLKHKNVEIVKIVVKSAENSNSFPLVLLYILTIVVFSIMHILHLFILRNAPDGTKFDIPFNAWVPWAHENYKQYCLTTITLMLISYPVSVYCIVAQLYLINSFSYITGELKILQHYVVNSDKYISLKKKNFSTVDEACHDFLKECIVRHQVINEIVRDFNDTFNMLLLLDFSTLSVQLANTIIQILTEQNMSNLLFEVVELLNATYQIYVMYQNADEIIVQSTKISEAVYLSNWTDMSEKNKSKLQIIILRSQRPLKICIGPVGIVSKELMMKIFKGVYTILAFYNTF